MKIFNTMKKFNGKAIYNPSGKAGEYSYWACNFYVGCSNGCTYCYCKKGILAGVMGQDTPQLKKCFKNVNHALEVFEKELLQNLLELQKHGLFFTFTSDPCLPETYQLTAAAGRIAIKNKVPIKILTKVSIYPLNLFTWSCEHSCYPKHDIYEYKKYVSIGFTLTGHDELEPNASTNAERIDAMRELHAAGFKTWASIEPIIDILHSKLMIEKSAGFCHLYKIGLESGKRYTKQELRDFVQWCVNGSALPTKMKFYFKDSLLKQADIDRSELPSSCVKRDFNMFAL